MMRTEDLVREEIGFTTEPLRNQLDRFGSQFKIDVYGLAPVEGFQNHVDISLGGGLVEADSDRMTIFIPTQIEATRDGVSHDSVDFLWSDVDTDRVEEWNSCDFTPTVPQSRRETACHRGDACPDTAKSIGTVIDGVHRRHDCQKNLRSADVAGGPISLDVLFTSLDGHAKRSAVMPVSRHADDSTGHLPDEGFSSGHEGRMRSAIAHWDSNRCDEPIAMSASSSPGDVTMVRASRSVAITTSESPS